MKKCSKCKIEKPFDCFGKNKSRKDKLQNRCKNCRNSYLKKWYLENCNIHKERVKKNRDIIRKILQDFIIDYLKKNHCIDCGEKDYIVLEFDHVKGTKSFAIGKAITENRSLELIKQEIDKCVVRCANCHRRKTAEQFNTYRYIDQYDSSTPNSAPTRD